MCFYYDTILATRNVCLVCAINIPKTPLLDIPSTSTLHFWVPSLALSLSPLPLSLFPFRYSASLLFLSSGDSHSPGLLTIKANFHFISYKTMVCFVSGREQIAGITINTVERKRSLVSLIELSCSLVAIKGQSF